MPTHEGSNLLHRGAYILTVLSIYLLLWLALRMVARCKPLKEKGMRVSSESSHDSFFEMKKMVETGRLIDHYIMSEKPRSFIGFIPNKFQTS